MLLSKEDTRTVANEIADQLGEKQYGPRSLITSIVKHGGVDFAQQLLTEALEIEQQGGMLTTDGERRRTLGGVYFYLARGRMPKETRDLVFPHRTKRKKSPSGGQPSSLPAFAWEERQAVIEIIQQEKGKASAVKITLIGRPGKIESRKDVIITAMTHQAKNASLPKGLPTPPATETLYTVYIASKQWRKVEEAITNPDDALIIEGTCTFDEAVKGMAVFATNVTTKGLEAEKRQKQKQATGEADAPAPAPAAKKPAAAKAKPAAKPVESVVETPAPPPAPTIKLPGNVTPDDAQKLTELHAAVELYRLKIATIEAKPEGQRFGLEMTQKLMKSAQDEISTIEARYA